MVLAGNCLRRSGRFVPEGRSGAIPPIVRFADGAKPGLSSGGVRGAAAPSSGEREKSARGVDEIREKIKTAGRGGGGRRTRREIDFCCRKFVNAHYHTGERGGEGRARAGRRPRGVREGGDTCERVFNTG